MSATAVVLAEPIVSALLGFWIPNVYITAAERINYKDLAPFGPLETTAPLLFLKSIANTDLVFSVVGPHEV